MKFPKLIHVVVEHGNSDPEDDFLCVVDGGVTGVDESGKEVAIYQLVKTGKVHIAKTFVEKVGR